MKSSGKRDGGAGENPAPPRMFQLASRAVRWRSLAIALGVCVVIGLTYLLHPTAEEWEKLELLGTIARFKARGQQPLSNDIRILGINQQFISSVAEYGETYPFARDLHAVVLRRLADAGAKVVVVDILFSEEGSWDESEDGALRDALMYTREQGCEVILAAGIDVSQVAGATTQQLILPAPVIMEAEPRLGLSNVAEKLSFRLEEQGGYSTEEFGRPGWIDSQAKAAWYALKNLEGITFKLAGPGRPYLINYAAEPTTYSGYLYNLESVVPEGFDSSEWDRLGALRSQLKSGQNPQFGLRGSELASAFSGKVVFYGSRNAADNDYFNTPFGQMFGVDTIAQSFDTLLRNRELKTIQPIHLLLIGIALTLLGWLAGLLRPLPYALGTGIVMLGAALTASQLLFLRFIDLPLAFTVASFAVPFLACTIYGGSVEEAERRRIRATFGRYMSDELVAQLVENPKLADLGGQRLQVAVMFCDIRNYSTISERLEPQWTVLMLNIFLGAMSGVIRSHGGFIDKYMGDGLLVCFGGPVPLPNPAQSAVDAALEMVRTLYEEVHPRLLQDNLPLLKIGIGIHFGPVVMGNIGSESRMDFTVVGDSVNVAARVESATKDHGWAVLVTKEVVESSRANQFGLVGEQRVKGREQAVELYRPIDPELGERLRI